MWWFFTWKENFWINFFRLQGKAPLQGEIASRCPWKRISMKCRIRMTFPSKWNHGGPLSIRGFDLKIMGLCFTNQSPNSSFYSTKFFTKWERSQVSSWSCCGMLFKIWVRYIQSTYKHQSKLCFSNIGYCYRKKKITYKIFTWADLTVYLNNGDSLAHPCPLPA